MIDTSRSVVIPSLIDTHGHAGHSLIKAVTENADNDWVSTIERFYREVLGQDVDTVIVEEEILMENSIVHTNERCILNAAQVETEKAVERKQLENYLKISKDFWGKFRY
ncbi:MAG: hypothetical protein ACFFFH_17050 [Candidatus Thorarchaeota archaeon]